jgi:hypothetical protein
MDNPHIKLSNALHCDNAGEVRGNGELLRRGIPDKPFVCLQPNFSNDRMGLTFQKSLQQEQKQALDWRDERSRGGTTQS